MKIRVKNDVDKRKEVKLGFSWSMFFFGVFVPLFRGDWKWFLIILGISLDVIPDSFYHITAHKSVWFRNNEKKFSSG